LWKTARADLLHFAALPRPILFAFLHPGICFSFFLFYSGNYYDLLALSSENLPREKVCFGIYAGAKKRIELNVGALVEQAGVGPRVNLLDLRTLFSWFSSPAGNDVFLGAFL